MMHFVTAIDRSVSA